MLVTPYASLLAFAFETRAVGRLWEGTRAPRSRKWQAPACSYHSTAETLLSYAYSIRTMSTIPDTVETTPNDALITAPTKTLSAPAATVSPSPSAPTQPPQSAAYPAMPSTRARDADAHVSGSPSVASPACEAGSDSQVATSNEPFTPGRSSDDTVIAGRRGSANGTIAVPSGQTTVPWPAVPGAPAGYPG